MIAITQLTSNALKKILTAESPAQLRDQFFVLQVAEVKMFKPEDNKKNIKSK
jgi:hypothetical protein